MDLADPSPPTGWRSRERQSFLDRSDADLVLALAVVHHLAISDNVPLGAILDMVSDAGQEAVIEFPTPTDPMVERLLRNKRPGAHDDYTVAVFEAELAQRFEMVTRQELPSGTRVLYHVARPAPPDG